MKFATVTIPPATWMQKSFDLSRIAREHKGSQHGYLTEFVCVDFDGTPMQIRAAAQEQKG